MKERKKTKNKRLKIKIKINYLRQKNANGKNSPQKDAHCSSIMSSLIM